MDEADTKTKVIDKYTDDDVLFGLGNGTNCHPGNKYLRQLVRAKYDNYMETTKIGEKADIAEKILTNITNGEGGGRKPGRFLKQKGKHTSGKEKLWLEATHEEATQKIKAAFRSMKQKKGGKGADARNSMLMSPNSSASHGQLVATNLIYPAPPLPSQGHLLISPHTTNAYQDIQSSSSNSKIDVLADTALNAASSARNASTDGSAVYASAPVDFMMAQVQGYSQSIPALATQNEQIKKTIDENTRKITEEKSVENEKLRKDNEILKKDLDEAMKKIAKVTTENDDLKKENEKLGGKLDTERKSLDDERSRLEERRKRMDDERRRMDEDRLRMDEDRKRLDDERKRIDDDRKRADEERSRLLKDMNKLRRDEFDGDEETSKEKKLCV